MGGHLTEKLAPPQDLRPAQLGIILVGRVIVGHIGATLTDLCQHGFFASNRLLTALTRNGC
jgi:hypothetical protein